MVRPVTIHPPSKFRYAELQPGVRLIDLGVPAIFQHKGYRFFFYSNEGEPREPLHVHVRKGEAEAKFWLAPSPGVACSYGMSAAE